MPLYFAYGSNLKVQRLRGRVGELQLRGIARLVDHRLSFAKLGKDGSGKACCEPAAGEHVWGALFALDAAQLAALDGFEQGYSRATVLLEHHDGRVIDAITYHAQRFTDEPVPFDWYLALILEGAREHGLPESWIDRLEAIEAREDLRKV